MRRRMPMLRWRRRPALQLRNHPIRKPRLIQASHSNLLSILDSNQMNQMKWLKSLCLYNCFVCGRVYWFSRNVSIMNRTLTCQLMRNLVHYITFVATCQWHNHLQWSLEGASTTTSSSNAAAAPAPAQPKAPAGKLAFPVKAKQWDGRHSESGPTNEHNSGNNDPKFSPNWISNSGCIR